MIFFLHVFLCTFGCLNRSPMAQFFVGLESDTEDIIQLHVSSLELRSEEHSFKEPWIEAQILSDGACFIEGNSLTKIGFVELDNRQNYIQTFVDVDSIFSDTQPIIDIVEPIATSFTSRYGHQYHIVIQFSIIEQQLFAVDSYVIENPI